MTASRRRRTAIFPARPACTDAGLPLNTALALVGVEVDHPRWRQPGDANVGAPALRARHRLHLLAFEQPVQVDEGLLQPLLEKVDLGNALLPVGQELLDPLEDDRSLRPLLDFAGDLVSFEV
jgi:hypothetical protein